MLLDIIKSDFIEKTLENQSTNVANDNFPINWLSCSWNRHVKSSKHMFKAVMKKRKKYHLRKILIPYLSSFLISFTVIYHAMISQADIKIKIQKIKIKSCRIYKNLILLSLQEMFLPSWVILKFRSQYFCKNFWWSMPLLKIVVDLLRSHTIWREERKLKIQSSIFDRNSMQYSFIFKKKHFKSMSFFTLNLYWFQEINSFMFAHLER